MDKEFNFEPNSEAEKIFFETHSTLAKGTSTIIRSLPLEKRFLFLKEASPSDTSLMALYIWAMKQEDYETCSVAKELLLERGFETPK